MPQQNQQNTNPEDLLATRLAAEVRFAGNVLANVPKFVALFGGSRVKPTDAAYAGAMRTAELLVESGRTVVTGGGPGIMQAGNEGAFRAADLTGEQRSVGLNIVLPFEQGPNAFQHVGLNFHQFASRKVVFCRHACAFVLFPGGFGTLDELGEVLTLMQTRKMPQMPIILYDRKFWQPLTDWMESQMLGRGLISEVDQRLMSFADSPEAVLHALENYQPIEGY